MSDYTLSFSAAEAPLTLAGGKGANLVAMTRAGFPVPLGFIVTTQAYTAFVRANGLQDRIQALAARAVSEEADLESISAEIRELFARGTLPAEVATSIQAAYRELTRRMSPVAVRSSATAEDLPGLAFAGQQDTYLNVVGDRALLSAVQACWGSLWTARAMTYRARNEVPTSDIALAVVVQTMVRSEVAGVLFTANPLTGRRDEMVIDATFGLGETVVSGQVESDHYIVDPQAWKITACKIGSKETAVIPASSGGTEQIHPDGPTVQALPDAQIIALARMAQRAEQHFGVPQDIEWAWAEDHLYLLQARPITSLYPLPATPTTADGMGVYVSFNAIQGVTDPFTPLGIDALRLLFGGVRSLLHLRRPMSELLPDAGGRLFLDFSDLMADPRLRNLGLAFLEHSDPAARATLRRLIDEGRFPARRVLTPDRMLTLLVGVLPVLRRVLAALLRPERLALQTHAAGAAYLAEVADHVRMSHGLVDLLQAMEHDLSRVDNVSFGVMPAVMAASEAMPLLDRWLGAWLREAPGAAMRLMRGLPGNGTVEMDLKLWAAAQEIQSDAEVLAAVRALPVDRLTEAYGQGLLPANVQRALSEFLRDYGMRGAVELDLGRRRWRDDPAPIIATLASYLGLEDPGLAPDAVYWRGREEAERLADEYVARIRRTPFGRLRAHLLRAAIRRMRTLGGLREAPLFYLVSVTGIYRQALLDCAGQLVVQGNLVKAEDIFFVPLHNLKQYARGEDVPLRQIVVANRTEYERECKRRQMPRVLLGTGEAYYEGVGAADMGGDELSGEPVSPGVGEGRVRVVLDPRGARLEPGEVLVCPSTDPGWTPLFLTAAGLVIEIGGLVTHGSVVAREYGLPAVVGVDQATTRLRTGQRVRVDGNHGRVVVLRE